jgi:hypothetical protein
MFYGELAVTHMADGSIMTGENQAIPALEGVPWADSDVGLGLLGQTDNLFGCETCTSTMGDDPIKGSALSYSGAGLSMLGTAAEVMESNQGDTSFGGVPGHAGGGHPGGHVVGRSRVGFYYDDGPYGYPYGVNGCYDVVLGYPMPCVGQPMPAPSTWPL